MVVVGHAGVVLMVGWYRVVASASVGSGRGGIQGNKLSGPRGRAGVADEDATAHLGGEVLCREPPAAKSDRIEHLVKRATLFAQHHEMLGTQVEYARHRKTVRSGEQGGVQAQAGVAADREEVGCRVAVG